MSKRASLSEVQIRLGHTGYWLSIHVNSKGNFKPKIELGGETYFMYKLPHKHGSPLQYAVDYPNDAPIPRGAYKR